MIRAMSQELIICHVSVRVLNRVDQVSFDSK
jgi:hypothetical protein